MITFRLGGKWFQTMARGLRNPAPLVRAAARGVWNMTRRHFADLERTRPNKMGGKRTHFWRAVRGSVQAPLLAGRTMAVISINHVALRQRLQGGVIRPVRRKWLTIPAGAEGYGKTAREFSDLQFGVALNPFGRLQRALGRSPETTGSGDRRTSILRDPVFFLTKRVVQKPDPTAMPSEIDLDAAARAGATQYLLALAERN